MAVPPVATDIAPVARAAVAVVLAAVQAVAAAASPAVVAASAVEPAGAGRGRVRVADVSCPQRRGGDDGGHGQSGDYCRETVAG